MKVTNNGDNLRGVYVGGKCRFIPAGGSLDLSLSDDDLKVAQKIEQLSFGDAKPANLNPEAETTPVDDTPPAKPKRKAPAKKASKK